MKVEPHFRLCDFVFRLRSVYPGCAPILYWRSLDLTNLSTKDGAECARRVTSPCDTQNAISVCTCTSCTYHVLYVYAYVRRESLSKHEAARRSKFHLEKISNEKAKGEPFSDGVLHCYNGTGMAANITKEQHSYSTVQYSIVRICKHTPVLLLVLLVAPQHQGIGH